MKKLFFLSILFLSCQTIKQSTAGRSQSGPVTVLTEAEQTLKILSTEKDIAEIKTHFAYPDKNFKVDSLGNLSLNSIITVDSLVIKKGYLYVGDPHKIVDTLVKVSKNNGAISYRLGTGNTDVEDLKWIRDFLVRKVDSLQNIIDNRK